MKNCIANTANTYIGLATFNYTIMERETKHPLTHVPTHTPNHPPNHARTARALQDCNYVLP